MNNISIFKIDFLKWNVVWYASDIFVAFVNVVMILIDVFHVLANIDILIEL